MKKLGSWLWSMFEAPSGNLWETLWGIVFCAGLVYAFIASAQHEAAVARLKEPPPDTTDWTYNMPERVQDHYYNHQFRLDGSTRTLYIDRLGDEGNTIAWDKFTGSN